MMYAKLKGMISNEVDRITEAGITPSNLDRLYKLIDVMKDINAMEGDTPAEVIAPLSVSDDAYARYMDSKRNYRYTHNETCKHTLITTLTEYMSAIVEKMENMMHDAECAEEKETIKRYITKLQNII